MKPILVINSGSSSLKFGLFLQQRGDEDPVLTGTVEGIGKQCGRLSIFNADGTTSYAENRSFASQKEALDCITPQLKKTDWPAPLAIGHRMVHGGPHLVEHRRITPEVLQVLEQSLQFAPLHIPRALELIRHIAVLYPASPQFACFDTVFHRTLPESAFRFPIPERFFLQGVRRYGFHGLSFASIVHQLGERLPPRTVIAHLGSGCSLAALENGVSVDTSMGLTPTGGVVMGTRTGDLDPGVVLFLMRSEKLDADTLESMLNQNCGLAAFGGTNDMRELEFAAAKGERNAQVAIDIFCRSIAKMVAAYAVVLGGLELLLFTGAIGEHSQQLRANICRRLSLLGIEIDDARNALPDPIISKDGSTCTVRVATSQEEKQIARHVRRLLTACE
ncbi:MAG TPA: acetate/propionate family kinase [Rhodanobacter sp.]|nr:acetate/propionate family kinase [Rhodanobacter sp.]